MKAQVYKLGWRQGIALAITLPCLTFCLGGLNAGADGNTGNTAVGGVHTGHSNQTLTQAQIFGDLPPYPTGTVNLQAAALFQVNSSTILPSARGILSNFVREMTSLESSSVLKVVGYTDCTGSTSWNDKLSTARAKSVRDWLLANGMRGDSISFLGKGSADPVNGNCHSILNRRVEIDVIS